MTGLSRREKLQVALEAADGRGAEDPLALDVREVVSFADTFLILTGRSDRQVRAIADGVEEELVLRGEKPIGSEGQEQGRWVLIDFGDLIVHVFQREVRDDYALERLWADAAVIALAGQTDGKPALSEPKASGARRAVAEPTLSKPKASKVHRAVAKPVRGKPKASKVRKRGKAAR
jgi:ribosome-associated protein